jgi:hypothetical protein
MVKPDLYVVPAGATAKKQKPMTLIEAVEKGDYLEILRAQRRDIADSLPDEKGPAKAALHRQLSIIAKEIEGLEALDQKGSGSAPVADETFNAEAI